MTSAFYIAHATAGRTRIRWAGDVSDKAGIVEVAEKISDIEGVDQAMPRIKTGSIIIEHDHTDWSTLEPLLTDKLSLEFTTPVVQVRTGIDVLNQGLDKVNGTLKSVNTDLPSVTVLLLAMLAITQALRGQVIGNSMSFIWYALSIAAMNRGTPGTPFDSAQDVTE